MDLDRPMIHLEDMKENSELLNQAFNLLKSNYNVIAKANQGRITTRDVNKIINTTMESYKEHNQNERWIIEGFCDFVMGMLPCFNSSAEAFEEIDSIFAWR